jgi:nucleoid-associated protein YgaU
MPATPPQVRADIMPELRLPSTRANAADATAPVPGAAGKKVPAQTKTATSEPAPAAQPKASESAASEAKPKKVEHRKSARQQPAKRAKAQRRAREARGARRPAKLVYVVRPGDTLSAIAERYLGSGRRYDVIYRANRHRIKSPNVIHAHQRIVVPLRKA